MKLRALPDFSPLRVFFFTVALGGATGVDFVASSMMGIAGTHIRGGVHASPEDFLWSMTSYAAMATLANLMLRRIAQHTSYRSYTVVGLIVAAIGSLLCALCETPLQLTFARAVQGFGAGGLFAASRILIQLVSARDERAPLFIGFNIGSFGLSAGTPWLAAVLVESAAWQMVFAIQVVLALAVLVLVVLTYPSRVKPAGDLWEIDIDPMDWWVVILFGLGAMVLMHGLGDLRFYELASSPSVALTPLVGFLLIAAAFLRLRREPQLWLDPRALLGRTYLVGLLFYAIYYFLNGLWNYLIPTLLQSGFGFGFQVTGEVLTWASVLSLLAMMCFSVVAPKVFGRRRYIALGYVMFAAALLMLSLRTLTGVSMDVILPALFLQGLTVPFVMAQVAGMTFVDFTEDDFQHAYAFKNIVRQIATAAGTGAASLWLQYGEAIARSRLVDRITVFDLGGMPPLPEMMAMASTLETQATLVASANLLSWLAIFCAVVAVLALVIRWRAAA
ncbi:multidrug efflux MFS transporter [Paraburkholderia sp. Ac-20340]|uniref:MFS transporter n=1 Tax=Paraburkholderia sp. Ac-20340 TaxID=2703888 RepID=UPI00197D72D1|nr:MFS transporter [Paraburkholderia sp. Ac-20340]MBN3856350.1 multidrug efflux MFS transporter [Paraburkholderia sp. Ac-20340]